MLFAACRAGCPRAEFPLAVSTQKPGTPVVGFNHNLKHGGRVYHVQTEDSGLPHAHYITHLFIGGNIVASMKTSYSEQVENPDLAQVVRKLMEGQHKQMVRRLVAGEFKDLAERFAAAHYEPGVLANGQTGPAAVNTGGGSAPSEAGSITGPAVKPAPRPLPKPIPPSVAKPAAGPVPAPADARPVPPVMAPKPAPLPPVWQQSPPTASTQNTVEFAPPTGPVAPARVPGQALPSTTRVAPAGGRPPVAPPKMVPVVSPSPAPAAAPQHRQPPPPSSTRVLPNAPPLAPPSQASTPPPSLLSPPATPLGVRPVMSAPVTPPPPLKRISQPGARRASQTEFPAVRPAQQPQLAAAKPVNIFADETPLEKPTDDLPTIFAEELISEKSLDEVILAFLSADLIEQPK